MHGETLPLVVGLPGTTLEKAERAILATVRPAGVVLFPRNIESPDQVRRLVAATQELEPAPFVCVDVEGGAVNRLTALWGGLPSPGSSAAAGRRAVRALGEAAGAACRMLGIHLNLAPVVDLRCPEGLMGREGRCLGDEAERVSTLARIYTEGLVSWGVGGCLKHFPGIGAVSQDTRQELPVLDLDSGSLDLHVSVFASLSEMVPVVMVAHVVVPSLGDTERPASLSAAAVERAASLPGSPVVFSDDLEMGALDTWGDLPDRVVHALRARNHGILVSTAFDRLAEIAFALRSEAETDDLVAGRIAQTEARLGTLRRDLCQRFAALPAPDEATVEQLWERARREAES